MKGTGLRRLAAAAHQVLLLLQWQIARRLPPPRAPAREEAVLVIPADAATLTGSRGDEAMLLAARAMARGACGPGVRLLVACSGPEAEARARAAGFEPWRVWGGLGMPFAFRRLLAAAHATRGWVMGADLLDGHYSPVTALRMVVAADLMARAGLATRFLGFSLNEHPARSVCLAFRGLDRRVVVQLRDPVSHERYTRATGRPARLVADTAFLLPPAPPSDHAAAAQHWVRAQRAQGRRVIALNAHPMLFGGPAAAALSDALAAALQAAMQQVAAQRAVSWLLLPHDERAAAGDLAWLAALHTRLDATQRETCHRLDAPPAADQIKTLLGEVDAALTGRMHLAIAALGQGRPVLALAYQGKFAGLLRHFGLPEWLLLDPVQATDAALLGERLARFVDALPALRERVAAQLPAVLVQARLTFAEGAP